MSKVRQHRRLLRLPQTKSVLVAYVEVVANGETKISRGLSSSLFLVTRFVCWSSDLEYASKCVDLKDEV